MNERVTFEWKQVIRYAESFPACGGCYTRAMLIIQFKTVISQEPVKVERFWTGLAQCAKCNRHDAFDVDKLQELYGEP